MVKKDRDVIGRLIAPVSRTAFMADYWERRPLHVARPRPAWCAELPGPAEIDALISHAGADDIRFARTTRGGGTETDSAHGDGRGSLFAAYRAYGDGWTIVVSAVHSTSPTVGQLAADLEAAVSHRVGVNLYFTPPRAQGFAAHADRHDVFVLQIAGRKRWRVFPPSVSLPLEDQDVPVNRRRLGRCLIDATLEPGHVLYMPRGFIHSGVADDESSVHLTIGVHPYCWMDLLDEVVGVAAERYLALRHAVPPGALASAPRVEEVESRWRNVLDALRDPNVLREASRRLRRRRARGSRSFLDGHFAAIDAARSLNLHSVVGRRRGVNGVVQMEGNRAVLEFDGNRVEGPAAIEPALRFVIGQDRFAVAQLPEGLTRAAKLELVRRLILEGLLTVHRVTTPRGGSHYVPQRTAMRPDGLRRSASVSR